VFTTIDRSHQPHERLRSHHLAERNRRCSEDTENTSQPISFYGKEPDDDEDDGGSEDDDHDDRDNG